VKVRFSEINLFGVYIAPIAPRLVVSWVIVIGLRRIAAHYGWLRYVWHPSMFVFSIYMIVLASLSFLAER
jgi:type IV secretory pathway VirB2 component (pilin)